MKEFLQFYINGEWVDPVVPNTVGVENPATEQEFAKISRGGPADVDRAVQAARSAFPQFSATSTEYRAELLVRIARGIDARIDEFAEAIHLEMGAPMWLAKAAQVPAGTAHFSTAAEVLEKYEFERVQGSTLVRKEPIGVCGFITPWNWPLNQIACKVAAALAVGCTIVLKPSEIAPLDAILLAQVIDAAGVPPGVFNLVNGAGTSVGDAIASHVDVDMVSFTGSTRAGVLVAKSAADTVKRISQELGGKSANIILPSADLNVAVARGVHGLMSNSGQSCNAPARMLVPAKDQSRAIEIAKSTAESIELAVDMNAPPYSMGPISSSGQYNSIRDLIRIGMEEGATLVTGGADRPDDIENGYFLRPTIFANVGIQMDIAKEEIFGPVLVIIPYDSVEEAIAIANDSIYGLSGCVEGETSEAIKVASQIRTGQVHINGAGPDFSAPFGGYKQSGNGREWGEQGFDEFLETKAILGAREVGAA